ncbi:helicase-exonuclease AddAB subunit AddA [Salsuginibacillus kocurii]|uniref:helicase-exonuclease AddAB subunit AddA n=1 Tax=Salsuginibacillus kocurii TaxID=427078 RepID=UPI000369EC94|nr:helicase-exonuclease AddAB subunit AddA [Salsuginibacillus kocurii]
MSKPKPENVSWTDTQWQAISEEGRHLLVAAAAGSGKTAVLVERMIQKVIDPERPVDVDRLLIVTFTNAAASEMKQRIAESIEKELEKQPASLHLRRQLALINKAHISTLHSFCMNLLRSYYYEIDLDPQFRIVDDVEGELLRDEVLEELLEEEYAQPDNRSFFDLVDRLSGDRSDERLRQVIRRLYDFSRSHPDPAAWLNAIQADYDLKTVERIDDLPWTNDLLTDIQAELQACTMQLNKALAYTRAAEGPFKYADTLLEDYQTIDKLQAASASFEALYQTFETLSFSRLPTITKKDLVDPQLKEQTKALRDQVKKQVESIQNDLFLREPAALLSDLRELKPSMETLVRITLSFSERFFQRKKEHALVDFPDLEQLTLQLLTRRTEDGTQLPSQIAEEYKRYFQEVLVDEYQDINLVQETILDHLSSASNRFMVGDVKQSIYKFRLADPGLFLEKYKAYETDSSEGSRIDLAKNFRSRKGILDSVNFLFRQIMSEEVGELAYDKNAELVHGNEAYPETESPASELMIINKGEPIKANPTAEEFSDLDEDIATAQLEGRAIARRIRTMIEEGHEVFDKETKQMRKATYRDMVVLMRSMPWAETFADEFKQAGIPVYADVSSGYFEAIEVQIIMSLLKVIDNPLQDIALASVLRSPIVGLNEQELALIRVHDQNGHFYHALKKTASYDEHAALREKAGRFLERLDIWRTKARAGALSDLIWELYRETNYFDFVGGMPGGKQRQANLRALYDRARAYEETSFRGLFRFLRFVERMQERGDDLGTARALSEQEDVVRIMTVHKSKGLEFPVVFLAGANKKFNMQDLHANVLLHKDLGFGSKMIDPKQRVAYPSLPQLAIKQRLRKESLAEEMRVLYVALTRAKEKLIITGTLHDAEKTFAAWSAQAATEEWLLPGHVRSKSQRYLDWVGPAVFRHKDAQAVANTPPGLEEVYQDESSWKVQLIEQHELAEEEILQLKDDTPEIYQYTKLLNKVPTTGEYTEMVEQRLNWEYNYKRATQERAKLSVSELKRELADPYSEDRFQRFFKADHAERPRFMQATKLTAAERGTAYHTVMQHLPLTSTLTNIEIHHEIEKMVANELMTEEQAEAVQGEDIERFLTSPLGQIVLGGTTIHREVAFSYAFSAEEAYGNWVAGANETVMVQGVADCLVETKNGELLLIDYKTDFLNDRLNSTEEAEKVLRERYKEQLGWYVQAISSIWHRPINEAWIYAFDTDQPLLLFKNGEEV